MQILPNSSSVLKESKYIKKIGCSIPKYSIDENFKSDYFNVSSSESKQNDKDIIRLPNALAVNGLQQKSSNHRISKSSLNNDEWEIFFVLDETNKKANQQEQRVTDKTERNVINKPEKNGDPEKNAKNNAPDEDQKSEIDHLDLDDLEWDDAALAYDVSYDEDERLIFERPR